MNSDSIGNIIVATVAAVLLGGIIFIFGQSTIIWECDKYQNIHWAGETYVCTPPSVP